VSNICKVTNLNDIIIARTSLRSWYYEHARDLPWRLEPSLYGTWLSEILLQQTRVETGIPKWYLFMDLFPTVGHLARASEDQVLKAWEGLGYYRRATHLHKAARVIETAGEFPKSYADWLTLPGVGPYTAAAIASIGLGEAVAAVDGNVQRVVARWGGITDSVDGKTGAQAVQAVADAWLDHAAPGNHNQAVMELGALVCVPRNPRCEHCPLSTSCVSAHQPKMWGILPTKQPKKKPIRWELTWHIVRFENFIITIQRPETGVWAKLWVFPETPPLPSEFHPLGELMKPVTHLLTHRRIEATIQGWEAPNKTAMEVYASEVGGEVLTWEELGQRAMPRLATKIFSDKLSEV
jgi:A/G-specific adenine glycosylase